MQLEFRFRPQPRDTPGQYWLAVGQRQVPLHLVRNLRARRYVLRLRPDGAARVTIPRGGSRAEAVRFANRHAPWVERQLANPPARFLAAEPWRAGTEILFRGKFVRLEKPDPERAVVQFGTESVGVDTATSDWRPQIERYLWTLAVRELPPRVFEFASRHQLPVRRIMVRNQRSRWGSCSKQGTISLNWRLIQAPEFVRDYIILHELAHLRHMNHSVRFWREVARLYPEFKQAERWLKTHALLR